jgi:hypothetical protein
MLAGDFEGWMKGLCLRPSEDSIGGPGGGLLYWVTWKMRYLRAILNALRAGRGGGYADGASLSMGAPLGERGGGLLVGDPKHYECRALGTGTSLYGGSVGATWGGLIYWDFKIWLRGLWRWSVSLRGSSMKGTWRGLPPGDSDGYVSVDGHLYIGAPVLGNLEEGPSTVDFGSRKGSRDRQLF